jgi:hypothetical protein
VRLGLDQVGLGINEVVRVKSHRTQWGDGKSEVGF